jgi:hypothetical protein
MKIKNTLLKVLGGLVLTYFAITVIASEGIVVDELGKPIKGAHVITYWQGNAGLFVQPHTKCYKLEATTSDENGRFSVSIYSGTLDPFKTNRLRSTYVFAPGYYTSPLSNSDDLKFVLAAFAKTETLSEQFDLQNHESLRGGTGAGCGNQKIRLPYLKSAHMELTRLAKTRAEFERCNSLLFTIEYIEFGDRVANERRVERRQNSLRGETK